MIGLAQRKKSLQLNCCTFPDRVRFNDRSDVDWSKGWVIMRSMWFDVSHAPLRSIACGSDLNTIFHIMKWAEAHSGLLNSVTVCRCGRVNERWLVNLNTGARFHVLHFHPRTIPK